METKDILKRIDELLGRHESTATVASDAAELSQGCVSLQSLVYGQQSVQVQQFTASIVSIKKVSHITVNTYMQVVAASKGTLKNVKSEIEAGLTGSLRHQVTGEVLTDLIQLAKAALDKPGDGAKNVAAVLAAAAFEDTLRRMGENLAGVVGEEDLPNVLKALKDAGIIQGPQVGIVQSYFTFRNKALHANWDEIQRESVLSAIALVEGLLVKHFS
jgi:hypothetical protein